MTWQNDIASAIAETGHDFELVRALPVGGGDINDAWRFEGVNQNWFVKRNSASRLDMFAAEYDALTEIADTDAVRVPEPLCLGQTNGFAFLVLEPLDLDSPNAASDAALGTALARMHRHSAKRFGWHRDNTIGSTPQANDRDDDWATFWRERRLVPQLERAAENGFSELQTRARPLLDNLSRLFDNHQPEPSLLHGDLWGGNRARVAHETPVIFDPATYYGDREADIAMTELFGRFSPGFYRNYEAAWPLDDGYDTRRDLYNLYHVLNHLNLFGGGYFSMAKQLITSLSDFR